jgi:hypothetical protein
MSAVVGAKEGSVYCLSNISMLELLKVGASHEESPKKRVLDGNTCTWVPTPFHIEFAKKVKNPFKIEKEIHAKLAEYRLKGKEFFKVSVEIVRKIFDEIDGVEWTESSDPVILPKSNTNRLNPPVVHRWLDYELTNDTLPNNVSTRILYNRFKEWALEKGEYESDTFPAETPFGKLLNGSIKTTDGSLESLTTVQKSGGLMIRTFRIPKLIETIKFNLMTPVV